MSRVQFHGELAARFPTFADGFEIDVTTPAQAIRALHHVQPGFTKHLLEYGEPGYRIVVEQSPLEHEDELHYPAVGKTIHFVPAIAGSAGLGKVLAGVALIGLSFVPGLNVAIISGFATTYSSLAFSLGISMALGGFSQALAGNPSAPTSPEAANNQPSYGFNGAVNTTGQGNPVPICYGRPGRVGSQLISAGIQAAPL